MKKGPNKRQNILKRKSAFDSLTFCLLKAVGANLEMPEIPLHSNTYHFFPSYFNVTLVINFNSKKDQTNIMLEKQNKYHLKEDKLN